MIRFILSRLIQGIVVVLLVLSITFVIIRLGPGSPFTREREQPAYVRENLERLYGLHDPILVQMMRNVRKSGALTPASGRKSSKPCM